MRDVRTVALPQTRTLCEAADEPVYLMARHGDQGVLLERLVPNTRAHVTMEAGERGPLHAGSLRKVLLAYAGEREIERYLGAGPLRRFTPWTTVEPDALRAQLEAIRRTGFAYTEQEGYEGMAELGRPASRPTAGSWRRWAPRRSSRAFGPAATASPRSCAPPAPASRTGSATRLRRVASGVAAALSATTTRRHGPAAR